MDKHTRVTSRDSVRCGSEGVSDESVATIDDRCLPSAWNKCHREKKKRERERERERKFVRSASRGRQSAVLGGEREICMCLVVETRYGFMEGGNLFSRSIAR